MTILMRCSKCHFDNPDTARFCSNCATPLRPSRDISISHTKTLQKPIKKFKEGSVIAGKYKIIDKLGEGGMGVVYKADDTRLKRTVALKFLPAELTRDPEAGERFVREAQAAAALSHPNICTIHEINEEEGESFIAMEYIDGQSLKEKIKSGPLEIEGVLDIATQVAEGLKEAHKKGIVHRDIKSANIMLMEMGHAKIMDFGLAKVVGGSLITKEPTTMGTVAYMSPEQTRGEIVDHRTDIWSLGVVVYEMISDQLPFKGERETSIMYSIVHEEPKSLKEVEASIPEGLEQVVSRALAKNPDERYQHIDELLDDLVSITEGFEPRKIKAKPLKKRVQRVKKIYLYAGIAAMIILLSVTGLLLFTGRTTAFDSIAVLPLDNLSGDPKQDYFADGMTEALITELSKIGSLRVISRQSVMGTKDRTSRFRI